MISGRRRTRTRTTADSTAVYVPISVRTRKPGKIIDFPAAAQSHSSNFFSLRTGTHRYLSARKATLAPLQRDIFIVYTNAQWHRERVPMHKRYLYIHMCPSYCAFLGSRVSATSISGIDALRIDSPAG